MRYLGTQKNKGFTIIESLVAISILIIAITGPLAIVAQSLRSSYFSRDQMTAFYLAQEAVEYIRNIRDKNSLQYPNEPDRWLEAQGFQDYCINDSTLSTTKKCSLVRDATGYQFQACDPSGCSPLDYDPDTGMYGFNDGSIQDESPFSRTIYINPVQWNESDTEYKKEVVLTVEIKWNSGGVQNSFKIREHLTNWKAESQ